jgi:hypothetical protein
MMNDVDKKILIVLLLRTSLCVEHRMCDVYPVSVRFSCPSPAHGLAPESRLYFRSSEPNCHFCPFLVEMSPRGAMKCDRNWASVFVVGD